MFEGKIPEEEKIPIVEKMLAYDRWANSKYPITIRKSMEIYRGSEKLTERREVINENL